MQNKSCKDCKHFEKVHDFYERCNAPVPICASYELGSTSFHIYTGDNEDVYQHHSMAKDCELYEVESMQNKWMIREEFERTHECVYCWISHVNGRVRMSYYCDGRFRNDEYFYSDEFDEFYKNNEIKAVMPIEKPEYPTCDAPIAHAGIAE